MMKSDIQEMTAAILNTYEPAESQKTAEQLQDYWLTFSPKSIAGISIEQRKVQETVGIPVPILQAIGKAIAREAKDDLQGYIPLARTLWEKFGREGRVIAVYPLGAMELKDPKLVIPILVELCRTCITWEDADQLAMRALEPIVRKAPHLWLSAMEDWLEDENKWVRRAGITVVGRLAMKSPEYTTRCLELAERLLFDDELDVKRAVSFAIRLSARGDLAEAVAFMGKQVPPNNPAATWVLCDVIRSMTKKFLPEFKPLINHFEQWAGLPELKAKDRRSIESAIKVLKKG
jgi:3-methyladenine DNA glycosylase AlkD